MTAKKTRTPKKAKQIAVPVEGKQVDAPRPQGRPSTYDALVANEILALIASGRTLRQTCRAEHLPSESTVRTWVLDDREGFSARYARARDLLLESKADEIFDIADDGSNDWMKYENKDGSEGWRLNGEHVKRSELRVNSIKWVLSKLKPERYGEKLELNGNGASPIIPVVNVTIAGKQANSAQPRLTREAGNSPTNRRH